MSDTSFRPRGRFFEEFNVGDQVVSTGRTVTEADIVNFAGVSGDFNQIHTDAVYAAAQSFEQRVAHGMLVHSIAVGLAVQTGIIEGTILAFRELNCKFSLPVYIGDTVHVTLEVVETKALPRLGGGNISLKVNVLNDRDEVVQRGAWVMLVRSVPA